MILILHVFHHMAARRVVNAPSKHMISEIYNDVDYLMSTDRRQIERKIRYTRKISYSKKKLCSRCNWPINFTNTYIFLYIFQKHQTVYLGLLSNLYRSINATRDALKNICLVIFFSFSDEEICFAAVTPHGDIIWRHS
jgi:hypothetical protein